jgi:hypothetical protein
MKNKARWLSVLLVIGAALETIAGLGLIFNPQGAAVLIGSAANPAGDAVARLAGGAVFGVAIACWCARKTPLTPAGLGASWALLSYNIVGCVTLTLAVTSGLANGSPVALSAAIVHGLLALAQLRALLARSENAVVA